jgi:hypothetical protein
MVIPTHEPLLEFLLDAVTLSNFYVPITLVRFDECTNRIVLLASKSDDEEQQIEILPKEDRLSK